MAVRHRIGERGGTAAHHGVAPARWALHVLATVVAVVALLVSIGLFFGGMTTAAMVAAVVCVVAGWGSNRLAAGGGGHD